MARRNWFAENPGKANGLLILLGLVCLEVLIRVLVAVDLLPYQRYPTKTEPKFYASIDPVVGNWRYPNATSHHRDRCVDVVYESNSAGALDRERTKASSDAERVIVLGDSYIAGWGLERGDRMSDLLEKQTGIEHLNFASPGFGTIQEWLYYKHYAHAYDHSRVMIFVLPENDFTDNDPDRERANVYEPYLRRTDSGYEVFYTVAFEDRYTGSQSVPSLVKNTIDNSLYIANLLRWATRALKDTYRGIRPDEPASDYDSYSPEDLAILLYTLDGIADLAGSRPVHVFTIPSPRDFEYARQFGADSRLGAELGSFAADRPNVFYVDLLPAFLADAETTRRSHDAYTLGCDDHWDRLGNEVTVEAVFDAVYGQAAKPL